MKIKNDNEAFFLFDIYLTYKGEKYLSIFFGLSKKDVEIISKIAKEFGLTGITGETEDGNYDTMIFDTKLLPFLRVYYSFFYTMLPKALHDYIIGGLCNVPSCCLLKCCDYASIYDHHILRLAEDYKKQLNGKKDPYDLEIAEKGIKYKNLLISHVPCSPDCKKTKRKTNVYNFYWNNLLQEDLKDKNIELILNKPPG